MSQLDFSQPPFDVLTATEKQQLKKHCKVRYLAADEPLNTKDTAYFFVVIKGTISHLAEMTTPAMLAATQTTESLASTEAVPASLTLAAGLLDKKFIGEYSQNDWFQPKADELYHALHQSLLLQIDASAVDKIAAQNPLVYQRLNGEITAKIAAINVQKTGLPHKPIQSLPNNTQKNAQQNIQNTHQAQQLMLQPISRVPLIPIHTIDENNSIYDAACAMTKQGIKHVLIKRSSINERHPTKGNQSPMGILTEHDICRAVSDGKNLSATVCADYANFKLLTIHVQQEVSDALLLMMRERVHRLTVVDDAGDYLGMLGQTDLLTFISHHSHLINVQIEQATDVSSLHQAVDMIGQYIRTQQQNGIKVEVISRMVQTLNAQVFTKLWRFIVPDEVYENTCVLVMGSEGRGEQIMRTDQDNALIIRNGFKHPDLEAFAQQFNQTLAQLGYPLCDGNIMMCNPMWRQPLSRFEKQITSWFTLNDPMYSVYVSAIVDGAYVCGDVRLFKRLQQHLKLAHQNADPMMIRQFARIALQYGEVNQWWQRFSLFKGNHNAHDIDLKKAGIFPIVHGVRAFAIENDIYHETSTKKRLKALVKLGVVSEKKAETLIETLHFFMAQRLSVALSTEDKLARQVNPNALSALERDLMKECLNVVKGFKSELVGHYQLNYA